MPSLKDLKKRISSVKNTQQTTKAMKMVSAAKLRRAQELVQGHKPYSTELVRMLKTVAGQGGDSLSSPLFRTATENKRALLLVVTSDRGLCAGFNSNLIKFALNWSKKHASEYSSISYAFVGKRGYDYFRTRDVKIANNFGEMGAKTSFVRAKKVADELVELFLSEQVDEVFVVYNEFKNAILQKPTADRFLPIAIEAGAQEEAAADRILKPNTQQLFESLLRKAVPIHIYRIFLESLAGEHGARMGAMENATRNAGEMIRKLALQYNKQRQAAITKELLEIISGSESQAQG